MADSESIKLVSEPWSNLSGKVVLITGASSGLGRELSINLAKAGCKVIAAARRVDRLKSLCHLINLQGSPSSVAPQAVALELDVTADPPAVEAAIGKAWAAFGHIHVLINNAGLRGGTSCSMSLSKDEWDDVFKTNLEGAWLCSKCVGLRMSKAGKGGGSIINITSTFGLNRVQSKGSLAYGSSKAGMHAMTAIMALEFGMYNIRVNAIAPTLFPSEITKDLFNQKWLTGVLQKITPMRPITSGFVEQGITELIRYLIHDSSKYVTGNVFVLDLGNSLVGVPIYSSL